MCFKDAKKYCWGILFKNKSKPQSTLSERSPKYQIPQLQHTQSKIHKNKGGGKKQRQKKEKPSPLPSLSVAGYLSQELCLSLYLCISVYLDCLLQRRTRPGNLLRCSSWRAPKLVEQNCESFAPSERIEYPKEGRVALCSLSRACRCTAWAGAQSTSPGFVWSPLPSFCGTWVRFWVARETACLPIPLSPRDAGHRRYSRTPEGKGTVPKGTDKSPCVCQTTLFKKKRKENKTFFDMQALSTSMTRRT